MPVKPPPTIVHVQQPPPLIPAKVPPKAQPVIIPFKVPPKPKPPPIVPANLAWRQAAFTVQVVQLFRLNRLCNTGFRFLIDATDHAFSLGRIDRAERDRLVEINRAGNRAKHEDLAWNAAAMWE